MVDLPKAVQAHGDMFELYVTHGTLACACGNNWVNKDKIDGYVDYCIEGETELSRLDLSLLHYHQSRCKAFRQYVDMIVKGLEHYEFME